MFVRPLPLLVGVALWSCVGCGQQPAQAPSASAEKPVGGVAVVDLDAVAKKLGRDIEMSNAVQDRMSSLNEKLTTLQSSLRKLYDEKVEKFGDSPNEEQQAQLDSMQRQMEQQLLERKRKAEAELAVYKQALVDQFREQTKPVLQEVAAARGLSIVVPKNNGLLLSIDPAAEITDDVAAKLQSSRPRSAAPAQKATEPRETEASADETAG